MMAKQNQTLENRVDNLEQRVRTLETNVLVGSGKMEQLSAELLNEALKSIVPADENES